MVSRFIGNIYSENATMNRLKKKKPRIKSYDIECYALRSKECIKIRKDRSMNR